MQMFPGTTRRSKRLHDRRIFKECILEDMKSDERFTQASHQDFRFFFLITMLVFPNLPMLINSTVSTMRIPEVDL